MTVIRNLPKEMGEVACFLVLQKFHATKTKIMNWRKFQMLYQRSGQDKRNYLAQLIDISQYKLLFQGFQSTTINLVCYFAALEHIVVDAHIRPTFEQLQRLCGLELQCKSYNLQDIKTKYNLPPEGQTGFLLRTSESSSFVMSMESTVTKKKSCRKQSARRPMTASRQNSWMVVSEATTPMTNPTVSTVTSTRRALVMLPPSRLSP